MVEGVRDGEEIPVREVVAERRDLVQRIRDLRHAIPRRIVLEPGRLVVGIRDRDDVPRGVILEACLLYTSDAADERSSVDLGGRRIIKKKKHTENKQSHQGQTHTVHQHH